MAEHRIPADEWLTTPADELDPAGPRLTAPVAGWYEVRAGQLVLLQPRREDFDTRAGYLAAWYTWRALRRDERLTDAELDAKYGVIEAAIRARSAGRA